MLPQVSARRPRASSAPVEAPARLPTPSAPTPPRAAPRGPPLFTLPGFIDIQSSPGQFLPIQRRNRRLRCFVVRHLDKAKATRAPGLPVGNEVDTIHHPIRREQLAHVLFCHGKREIPHKNLHWMSLLGVCHQWPLQDGEEKTVPSAIIISHEVLRGCEKPLL